jgi:hypothetical protein
MLLGNAAQGQRACRNPSSSARRSFLAAENGMGVFEAGKRETEVIELAVGQLASDGKLCQNASRRDLDFILQLAD